MKQIELKENEKIPFVWRTDKYGRAQFTFCIVWKGGRPKEVFIYPRQQEKESWYWHAELYGDDFSVQSWSEIGQNPYIWRITHCRQHKSMCLWVYVPTGSEWFELSCGGIYFGSGPIK